MRVTRGSAPCLAKCASGCVTETIYTACLVMRITFAGKFAIISQNHAINLDF